MNTVRGLIGAALAFLAATAVAKEVTVTADDTMRFSVSEIQAKVGEELTIRVENLGKLPKQAMGHNFVLLSDGADVAAFGNAAVAAAGNEYIPTAEPFSGLVVGHTKLLGPGESDTLTVTFEAAGSYPFLCSFPGHWALMKGTVVVTE